MHGKMTFSDSQGKEIICDVVAIFNDGNTKYVVYTDNSLTDGKADLIVSKLQGNMLLPVIEEKELEFVDNYLSSELFKEDEFDD